MKASLASTIAVLALGLGAGGVQAADNYLVQLDDTSSADTVTGNTYTNGALIQSVVFSGDRIVSSYGLWSGATVTSTFDNQYNYYEGDGVTLSDTVEISGNVGDTFITIAFNSDTDATPLTALASGGHFIEDGTFQPAVSPGTVRGGLENLDGTLSGVSA